MFYDRFTRVLHLLFAVGIVAQLFVSEWMHHPRPDKPGNFLYEIHEYLGIALLIVLLVHWLWSLVRGGPVSLGQFFPWFTAARRAALWADIRLYLAHIVKFRLPGTDEPSPLAGAVQGLGLLVVTAMAASGTIIYFYTPETWQITGWLRQVFEIHELLANLVWAYLVVHIGASILHRFFGHKIVTEMFNFWGKNPGS
ncbi:MAG: cytochrome b/b6 domain-containing protein [Sneathiella sp.]|nr:cytochrome b/b6 domain-containing protein [Sneathiella sp.]